MKSLLLLVAAGLMLPQVALAKSSKKKLVQAASETEGEESEGDAASADAGDAPAKKKKKKKGGKQKVDVGMDLSVGKTEYTNDKGDKFELDRRRFGLATTLDVGGGKTVSAHLGRVIRSEVVDAKEINGNGYEFGAGFANRMNGSSDIVFVPFLNFNYLSEEFTVQDDVSWQFGGEEILAQKKSTLELGIYEFVVGGLVEFKSTEEFTPYLGAEIFPLSEGEAKFNAKVAAAQTSGATGTTSTAKGSRRIDFERDDIMNLIFGAKTDIGGFSIGGQAKLISETTFSLNVGFEF